MLMTFTNLNELKSELCLFVDGIDNIDDSEIKPELKKAIMAINLPVNISGNETDLTKYFHTAWIIFDDFYADTTFNGITARMDYFYKLILQLKTLS